MLGHISFAVADLARTTAFYDAAMAPIGFVRVWTSENSVGYGPPGDGDKILLIAKPGPITLPHAGFHLAFDTVDRQAVDRFHAEAIAAGGVDRGAPGLRPHYGPNYYAAFVADPDGYHLEAKVRREPE